MTQITPGMKRHQKHRAQLLGFVPLGILSLRLQTVSIVAGFYGCLVFCYRSVQHSMNCAVQVQDVPGISSAVISP